MDSLKKGLWHEPKSFEEAQRRAAHLRQEGYRTEIKPTEKNGEKTFEVYAFPKLLKFNEAKKVYREPTAAELEALEK